MRWLLAGVLFACAVGLAIGTSALRAENARMRRAVELERAAVQDRAIELRRLDIRVLDEASPDRLAAAHRRLFRSEADRRRESLQ